MSPNRRLKTLRLMLVSALGVAAMATAYPAAAQSDEVAALKQHIQTLEQRLRKLEDRLAKPLTVKAPFIVEDANGQKVLAVAASQTNRGAYLYTEDDKYFATLALSDGGGLIKAYSRADELTFAAIGGLPALLGLRVKQNDSILLEASQNEADPIGLRINNAGGRKAVVLDARDGEGGLTFFRTGAKPSVQLGRGTSQTTALRFFGNGTTPAAAVGIDTTGNGAVRIADGSGKTLAEMGRDSDGGGAVVTYFSGGGVATAMANLEGGKAALQVYARGGGELASLSQGANGGLLQLSDLGGRPMVEAGNNGRVGIVRAGPISRGTAGVPGLPGSYILGSGK